MNIENQCLWLARDIKDGLVATNAKKNQNNKNPKDANYVDFCSIYSAKGKKRNPEWHKQAAQHFITHKL